MIDFAVGGETFQTWYRVLGDLRGGVRPLVLIHGGPGIPHDYLTNHDELYKAHSIPLIWYDQLGCGSSTHLAEKPEEFWRPELFMDELENLIAKLGIADDFDVLGHSWGGQLASQWASVRHPAGLKRLVIVGSPASIPLGDQALAIRLEGLPEEMKAVIRKHLKAGTVEDPEYKDAVKEYFARHICRLDPWPEAFARSLARAGEEPSVGKAM